MTHAPAAEAVRLSVRDVDTLGRERLREMRGAGVEVLECHRVLGKSGLNVTGELLRGQGTFYELHHYPEGDVFDKETASQYYFHAHRGMPGENGHIHTFMRRGGIPPDAEPVPYEGETRWPLGENAVAHLIAISMDRYGYPIGLFATNRWVTDETWYRAADVIRMLGHFAIDHAYPSWATNRWLTAMMRLFRPEIEALLHQRDAVIERWAAAHPGEDVYEDRRLEVTGQARISVEKRIAEVGAALASRGE